MRLELILPETTSDATTARLESLFRDLAQDPERVYDIPVEVEPDILPDWMWVEIQKGIDDLDAGRSMTLEEAEVRFQAHRAKRLEARSR